MKYDEICNHIINIYNTIKDESDKKIKMGDDSIDGLVLDSVDFVQLIVQIESDFSIEFPDEYLLPSELNSVEKIATIIETLI